jgi:2-polyprenyl-3-methyl-5-hydroxy-6-metoxy-1,4-benzoquinol methylase
MRNNLDAQWEERSSRHGSTLRSVLFKGLPEIFNNHIHKWHVETILKNISYRDDTRILDVGCGYGRITIPIINKYPNVEMLGMDISKQYVNLYEENTGREAIEGNVKDLSSDIGLFDYIICVTVLMYLDGEDLKKAMKKMISRLKPGGRLILIENDRSGYRFQTAFGLLEYIASIRCEEKLIQGRIFGKKELENIIEDSSGRIISERRMPFTTILFLILYVIAKHLPIKLTEMVFTICAWMDGVLENSRLSSIYVARIIEKNNESL